MAKRPSLLAGERQKGESDRAIQACNDYLRMGPGRSLTKLLKKYSKLRRNAAPTSSIDTLTSWSAAHAWQVRASAYDAEAEAAKNEKRRQVMEHGLALDYERVTRLKRLARLLEEQIYKMGEGGESLPNVWIADVKQIGSGEDAERVDLVRFNAAILAEYRAAMADLAAETGGRKQRHELTGANGQPIEHRDVTGLTDEELANIARSGSARATKA